MDPAAPTPSRLSRAEEIPVASDAVAFLIIAPIIGSVFASMGFWLVALVFAPPLAVQMTIVLGGPPALASLLAARWTQTGSHLSALIVAVTASIAMTLHLRLSLALDQDPSTSIAAGWWIAVAFFCALVAYNIAAGIRRPGRVAAVLLGLIAGWCLVWTGALYIRN